MTPLSYKQRRLSLFILVLAFLITGPWILLNSFGYKLDDAFSFIKTGGIYVHSDIANAEVYVDGEFLKNNGGIFRNTLIQKLKPGQNYNIRFVKEGYRPWEKEIYVYPGLVSEARILMLPDQIEARQIFPFFDDEKNGTTTPATTTPKTKKGKYIPQNREYLEILTLFEGENPFEEEEAKNPLLGLFEGSTTTPTSTPLEIADHFVKLGIEDPDSLENLIETPKEVSWLDKGNIYLYWIDEEDTIPYFYCTGVKERICNSEIILNWEQGIQKFTYFPGRNDVWVALVGNQLFAIEIDARSHRTIQLIYEGYDLDFVETDSGKIVVSDNGEYFELEL